MVKLFPTYEIGSLPKLRARVKAISGNYASIEDIDEVKKLGDRFNVYYDEVVNLLCKQKLDGKELNDYEKSKIIDFNSNLYIKLEFGFIYRIRTS